ncbi:MAG TPA: hypothetical protein VIB78_09240 [Acidimicrobiia bacterium]
MPLGAGGVGFVRFNGRVYEIFKARSERRKPSDLYHTALEIYLSEDRFVVENAWPSPDANTHARGVVLEGPVFSRRLARFRPFRYEVRCWSGGVISDAAEAVEVQLLGEDEGQARDVIELVATVPPLVWGRAHKNAGEMWNSNSVISYLLTRAGVDAGALRPPEGGRAPGWKAGVLIAQSLQFDEVVEGKSAT